MRDLALSLCILPALAMTLRYPYLGVMFWVWVSLQDPHQETYSFALRVPWVFMIAALATLCWILSSERKAPPKGMVVPLVLLLLAWTTLNTAYAFDPSYSWPYWNNLWKTILMAIAVGAMGMTRVRIHAMIWVIALSLGYYGIKGGIFTLATGGYNHVYGPPDSMIGDNNELALALVMILPILNYLRLHSGLRFVRIGLAIGTALCLASVLGSYSREAYIALGVLGVTFWIRAKNKFAYPIVALVVLLPLLHFMPASFYERFNSIQDYSTDMSFQSRLDSWWIATRYAMDHFPFGAGFYAFNLHQLWNLYIPGELHAVHSIYFQTLGEQGVIGLAIYLALLAATLLNFQRVIRTTNRVPSLRWANDLARMMQVSLISFMVGGAAAPMNFYDCIFLWALLSASLRQQTRAATRVANAGAPPVVAKEPLISASL
jgi:putative inorganic carbon (hco3(-)) transporter